MDDWITDDPTVWTCDDWTTVLLEPDSVCDDSGPKLTPAEQVDWDQKVRDGDILDEDAD